MTRAQRRLNTAKIVNRRKRIAVRYEIPVKGQRYRKTRTFGCGDKNCQHCRSKQKYIRPRDRAEKTEGGFGQRG